MLQQRNADNGVVYFASPLLEAAGTPHAFSTRIGGVSSGVFDSLNLGNPAGASVRDSDANLTENYRRLMVAAGLDGRRICRVHQVHSADVCLVSDARVHEGSAHADALVTADPAAVVSMRTADCVPVLLATRDGRWVAAVHAGWRGVIAGVLPATIVRLCQWSNARVDELLVAIGPCISGECFEVGPEVATEFRRVFAQAAPIARTVGQKAYIDLRAGLATQAQQQGIPQAQLDLCDLCTYRQPSLFYSHRRDNGITGRMAAFIGARPSCLA